MLYVRGMDKRNNEGERIDGSYGKIAQLTKAMLKEVKISQACEHNGRLLINTLRLRVLPEKEPPRTTTICRFVGATGIRRVEIGDDGGSDEWCSTDEVLGRLIAGNTLINIANNISLLG